MKWPVIAVVLLVGTLLVVGCGSSAPSTTATGTGRPASTNSASGGSASATTTSASSSTSRTQTTTTSTTATASSADFSSLAPQTPLDVHDLCDDLTLADAQSFAPDVQFSTRDTLGDYSCDYADPNAPNDPTVGLAIYAPGHGLASSGQAQELYNELTISSHKSARDYTDHFIEYPFGSGSLLVGGSVGSQGDNVGFFWVQNGTVVNFAVSSVPGAPMSVAAHLMSLLHQF